MVKEWTSLGLYQQRSDADQRPAREGIPRTDASCKREVRIISHRGSGRYMNSFAGRTRWVERHTGGCPFRPVPGRKATGDADCPGWQWACIRPFTGTQRVGPARTMGLGGNVPLGNAIP